MISIIIPFFNADQTLERAIKSVLKQEYKIWELILVNDGSADQSEEVASPYLDNFKIRYYHQENKGVSSARNLGAKEAKGEWLIFLDGDDELENKALSLFNRAIEADYSVDVWLAGFQKVDVLSNTRTDIMPIGSSNDIPLSGTFLIRKELFNSIKGYDDRFTFGENSELFRRVKIIANKINYIKSVSLVYYDKPIGGSKNMRNMEFSMRLLLIKYNDYFNENRYEKRVYLQIAGVCNLRMGNYSQARKDFLEAYKINPKNLNTLGRLIISFFSPIARVFYPLADFR